MIEEVWCHLRGSSRLVGLCPKCLENLHMRKKWHYTPTVAQERTYQCLDGLGDTNIYGKPLLLAKELQLRVLCREIVLQLQAGSHSSHHGLTDISQLCSKSCQKHGLRKGGRGQDRKKATSGQKEGKGN